MEAFPNAKLSCQFAGRCSGCEWIAMAHGDQMAEKRKRLGDGLAALGFSETVPMAMHVLRASHVRDRVDFNVKAGVFGLYDVFREALVDITACPMLTPAVEVWLKEFRQDLPDVTLGSVRLRVSPEGKRGAWLDFANEDVKRLLDERAWLTRLSEKAVVEIGQKKKRLVIDEERLRLGDPVLENWMNSFGESGPLPLYTSIGAFTQPGNDVNRLLVQTVMGHVLNSSATQWVELGAGAGNFTLPLLQNGKPVIAIENDSSAVMGLERGATEIGKRDLLQIHRTSFESFQDLPEKYSLLVDPPRSGLGRFLHVLEQPGASLPDELVYVSCSQESLLKDSERLGRLGYAPRKIDGVELFPQTRHIEWIVTFTK